MCSRFISRFHTFHNDCTFESVSFLFFLNHVIVEPRKASQTTNLKTIMAIKLAEAYKGRKKSMRFRLEHDCTRCSTRENICRFCNGEGRYITFGENIAQSWKDCEHCNGTGKRTLSPTCTKSRKLDDLF